MGKFKKELTVLSDAEHRNILETLKQCNAEPIEVDKMHSVFIVSPKVMAALINMKKAFGRKLKRLSIPTPRDDPYYYVAKFINPKDIAISYHFTTVKKYIYVKDKESIRKNMPIKWEIWVNKQKLLAREAIENTDDIGFQEKIRTETSDKIAKARIEYDFLYEHLDDDDLKALWTTYKISKEYPTINYKMEKKSYINSYLRQYVPNILQYTERKRVIRLDNEVEDFIENSVNAFDFFYYKIKKN